MLIVRIIKNLEIRTWLTSFVRGVFRKYKDIARYIGNISLWCVFC